MAAGYSLPEIVPTNFKPEFVITVEGRSDSAGMAFRFFGIPLLQNAMTASDAIPLLNLLQGGRLSSLSREGQKINFSVYFPEIAGFFGEGADQFFGAFTGVREFVLQPVLNNNLLIHSAEEIIRLKPVIISAAEAPAERLKIYCRLDGMENTSALLIRADSVSLFDPEFDPLDAELMQTLRRRAGLSVA